MRYRVLFVEKMRKIGFFLLVSSALFVWPDAQAKSTPQEAGQLKKSLQHEVSVILKLIQVFVADKHGQPVTDLTKEDFELRDNGARKNLTDFEKHIISLGRTQPVPQLSVPPNPAASVSRINRKFFLFFDFAFNSIAGIFESRKAALHFIDTQVQLEDELGVISYSTKKGFILHEYLTTDHKKARQVIEGFSANKLLGRAADIESDYLKELEKTGEALKQDYVSKIGELEERTYEKQVANIISDIIEFAKAIRYIPGSKNIILFSAGIANFVMYGSEKYMTSFMNRYGSTFLRDKYTKMCEELAGSNCTVYAINVAGIGSAHFRDRDLIGDWSLQQVAKESGGRYFDNINSYKSISEEIQKLTSNYYVLGYPIDLKWDGEYHSIKVTVKRKDCLVYGQKGYFNPKTFLEYSENEKVLHLIDLALSEKPQLQEAVDFPLTVVPYAVKEKTDLFVLAKIPTNRSQGKAGEKNEIVTIVFNAQNDIASIQRKEVNLGQYGANEIIDVSSISLAPGPYECRVVVRNMATGKGDRGAYQVSVSEARKLNFILLPPLLLEPGKQPIFIEEGIPTKKEPRFLDIFQFDPNLYYPLIGRLGKTATKLLAVVRCIIGGDKESGISFSGSLADVSSQKSIPVSVTVVSRYQEQETYGYLLDLNFPGLEPGRYSLNIYANVKNSDEKASASSSFVVGDAQRNIRDLKKRLY